MYPNMDIKLSTLNWSLLQSFAAVGEHGSLSAAARATGATQPTLSRHISILEQQLGARLFDRAPNGAKLTMEGLGLLRHAQDMADAAARISIAAGSKIKTLTGTVRITASHIVANYVLPEIITNLRIQEPEIDIELTASDKTENLLRREADIAVRMYRPTQLDIITKKVGDLKMGMYAAPSYLQRFGIPNTLEEILNHDVIGYDRSTQIIYSFQQAGVGVDRSFFAFRSDDHVVCWKMVVAGYGVGFNIVQFGDADTRVKRIEVPGISATLPMWLASHIELKTSPRVRRVFDFLGAALLKTSS